MLGVRRRRLRLSACESAASTNGEDDVRGHVLVVACSRGGVSAERWRPSSRRSHQQPPSRASRTSRAYARPSSVRCDFGRQRHTTSGDDGAAPWACARDGSRVFVVAYKCLYKCLLALRSVQGEGCKGCGLDELCIGSPMREPPNSPNFKVLVHALERRDTIRKCQERVHVQLQSRTLRGWSAVRHSSFRPMKWPEHVQIFSLRITAKTQWPCVAWCRGAIVAFFSPCVPVCACNVDIRRR